MTKTSYTTIPQERPWQTAREQAIVRSWTKALQGQPRKQSWIERLFKFLFGS